MNDTRCPDTVMKTVTDIIRTTILFSCIICPDLPPINEHIIDIKSVKYYYHLTPRKKRICLRSELPQNHADDQFVRLRCRAHPAPKRGCNAQLSRSVIAECVDPKSKNHSTFSTQPSLILTVSVSTDLGNRNA
jgi:hypothetical protein